MNTHKVITAGPDSFTVYYTDTQKSYRHNYDRPLLPYLKKLRLFPDNFQGKSYQEYEMDEFTALQNRIYKDAVYGLNSYSIHQLRSLTTQEKMQIQELHAKAQVVINRYKQEKLNKIVDDFLIKTLPAMFPRNKQLKQLFKKGKGRTCAEVNNTMSFGELSISRKELASKLVEKGILPQTFFQKAA
jgi:hypothetical protein